MPYAEIVWLVLGIVLILSEFLVPGLVVIFFGLGAVFVSLLVSLGWLPGLPGQLTAWALTSFLLIIVLRRQFRRWFPALESYTPFKEEEHWQDRPVEVLELITPEREGRVRWQGTSWIALSDERLEPGTLVKITGRDNLRLHVAGLVEENGKE